MKPRLLLALSLFIMLANACKKDNNNNNSKNTNPTSPYYFKFNLDGTDYNFNASLPQYMPFHANEAGGYEVASNAVLLPSVGIRFSWPNGDTVTENDLMGLKGKTLHCNDTAIRIEVSYSKDASTEIFSIDTADKNFGVTISSLTILKNDTVLGYPLKTYVLTGSCSAVFSNGATKSVLSNGNFNFIICRQDN